MRRTETCKLDVADWGRNSGTPGIVVGQPERILGCSWGSWRVMGLQVSMTRARAASDEWKPRARLKIKRTTEFSPSARALSIPRCSAARIPSRCLRIVLAVFDGRGQPGAGRPGDPPVDQLAGLVDGQVTGEDLPEGFLEGVGAPKVASSAAQLAQGRGLAVQVVGVLQQAPAGALEPLGGLSVTAGAQFVPGLATFDVQRVGDEFHGVERVVADRRLGGVPVGAHGLGVGRTHVHGDGLDPSGAVGAEVVEERVQGRGVPSCLAPHDLLGVVVGQQGQVVVVLPRHLVHPEVHQALEAIFVQAVGDHPLADPPHGVPVDAQ